MQKTKILHIAPINTSGVPGQFVLAERQLGYESRLVTLFKDKRDYFNDVCLDLPLIDFKPTKWIKKHVSDPKKLVVTNKLYQASNIPPKWKSHSTAEFYLVKLRDFLWKPIVETAIEEHQLESFDIIQLDGGLGFFRHSGFVKKMKSLGKKIICCYTGSDLRTRGVIPAIDNIADLNVTVEFDHLFIHPNIKHVFFPFDEQKFDYKKKSSNKIRIGHAPTNRAAKGSDVIIPALNEIAEKYPVEIVLIENMSYKDAIFVKQSCDIFVDQIGDLGYGINSLESLAMGIATCSCLAPGFEEKYPDHPFIVIDKLNLKEKLIELVSNNEKLNEKTEYGRKWVEQTHDAVKVVQRIHKLAGITS